MPPFAKFSFCVHAEADDSHARAGILSTPHGKIETPAFVFCATKGSIKAAIPDQVAECGTQMILGNTYHLMLQPGADLVAAMGGLHRFMGWDGPLLTDSGGFQIFSLGYGAAGAEIKANRGGTRRGLVEITEDGAAFRSHLDGSRHLLGPEGAIDIQRKLGADLILVLDECTPYHVDKDYTARSMTLTHRWAERGLAEFGRGDDGSQALYGIVQGGIYPDLRHESAEFVSAQPFFGHAVGGCLGGDKAEMYGVFSMALAHLHRARPIHLLGIGEIDDVWEGVSQGIDTFDCVQPTRIARHGGAYRKGGEGRDHINLRNACYREDSAPVEDDCTCYCCRRFTRAYLHHLLKAGEMLALQLLTLHNITFMNRMMAEIRAAIEGQRFAEARRAWAAI